MLDGLYVCEASFCNRNIEQLKSKKRSFILKRHVPNKDSVINFIARFNRALGYQIYQPLMANHCNINEKKITLEICMANGGTNVNGLYQKRFLEKYKIFESWVYIINTLCEDEASMTYTIEMVDESSKSISRKLII